MQEDKKLKELLNTGGFEKTFPAFTGNVMKRIERINYINAPLISNKWIRVYRLTFFTVLALLIAVSLWVKISSLIFHINLQLPDNYLQYTNTLMIYIVAFWALVFLGQTLGREPKL
jgi:hypothetical protein